MDRMITNKAGLEFCDPGFRPAGMLALRLLFGLPPSTREGLLFGGSPGCLPLQKALRWSLGGSFVVRTRFTDGPLSAHAFECWSSEKYFMLGSRFENEVQRLLETLVTPGSVVYDVGSHIGYMALLFAALVGVRGRVFCFEPSPINYSRLKRNIELNPRSNVTVTQAAVSESEGSAWLREQSSQSEIVEASAGSSGDGVSIRTLRLDDFIYRDGNPPPTFLKIDVEGHAGPCLRGMRRTIRENRPSMILEIHHTDEAEQVSSLLGLYGYDSAVIDAPDRFPRRVVAKPRLS
jgi:FkbM family methyltransferase